MCAPETMRAPVANTGADALPARAMHLRSSCGLYGAEGVIAGLARAYSGPCRVVCFQDAREPHTELCDLLMAEGLDAGTLPSRGALDPTLVFRVAAALRHFRPDVVHTHDYKTDAVAWLATSLPGVRPRLVATMHGVVRTSAALRGYERLDARVLRRFDAVAAVSDETADVARSYGIRADRIHVIPNGVDTEAFMPGDHAEARRALGLPPDVTLVGVVGRLSPEKGHGTLLEALKIMKRRVHVAIVGDGPLETYLKRQAGPAVHFMGRRDDMPRVYSAFDMLALPSLSEGLPLTALEAAACGIPIVASRVGDVEKIVRPNETGALVPPGDAAALASALDAMPVEPERLKAMGRAARACVVKSYSRQAMSDAYTSLYRHVLRRTRA